MHDQHHRRRGQADARKAVVFHRMRRHGRVDPVLEQRFEHLLRVADVQAHLDRRIALPERGHGAQDVVRTRGAEAQAAEAQVAGVAQQVVGLAFMLHQLLDHRHQRQPHVAQVDPAGTAVEQLNAIRFFELADAAGDGGLAHAQLPGRHGDAALARHFEKGHQQVAKHGHPQWLGGAGRTGPDDRAV
ncbi:hypothetical protein D9M70_554840 [compost metagenome]